MMIEKIIRDYLSARLSPVPVYLEVPANPPKKFILVEKTGSSRTNYLNTAMFAVQSYDESMFKASSLNELVKEALLDATTLNEVSASVLNSDYPYPDVDRKEYRYQAVFNITHY